jgi:hypothetical protein
MLYKKNKFMVYLGEIDIKMIEELGHDSDDSRSKVLRKAIQKVYRIAFGEPRYKALVESMRSSMNHNGNDI